MSPSPIFGLGDIRRIVTRHAHHIDGETSVRASMGSRKSQRAIRSAGSTRVRAGQRWQTSIVGAESSGAGGASASGRPSPGRTPCDGRTCAANRERPGFGCVASICGRRAAPPWPRTQISARRSGIPGADRSETLASARASRRSCGSRRWRGAPDEGTLPQQVCAWRQPPGPLIPGPSPNGRRGRSRPPACGFSPSRALARRNATTLTPASSLRPQQRLGVGFVQFEDAIVRNDKLNAGHHLEMRATFRRLHPHPLRRRRSSPARAAPPKTRSTPPPP